MEVLCIVALLLSAVAARPDPWWQWEQGNSQFPPFGGPQQDPDRPDFKPGDNGGAYPPTGSQPADADGGNPGPSGPYWPGWEPRSPIWPGEMPPRFPHRPSRGPGNGGPQRPIGGADGSNRQPGGPPQIPDRGDGRAPDFGLMPDEPGAYPDPWPPRRPGGRWGRPRGPPRGGRPNMRDPNGRYGQIPPPPSGGGDRALFDGIFFGGHPDVVGNREFIPIFKADNVTFQNVSGLPLKEGENVFLLPRGRRGPPRPEEDHDGPQRLAFGMPSYGLQPYLKLIYNPTATNKISFEYGLVMPVSKC
ncbi:uncharacterized protein LOC139911817 [Centroberyx gerrardi]